jgi:hypothetical protein
LVVANVGAANFVHLNNQDAGSTASNRIITGTAGSVNALNTNDTCELIYDGTTQRWRIINHGA